MDSGKKLYILLTRTHTKVASVVRYFGKTRYNHCALALDKELSSLYSFARPNQHGLLLGKLVKETKDRYTKGDSLFVESCVIEIPVTDEQYQTVVDRVLEIERDDEYMYNFMSVILYPVCKGMSVYKSYSCVEFVCAMIQMVNERLTKKACRYIPDDLYHQYQDMILFEGDLRHYMSTGRPDDKYYAALTWSLFFLNLFALDKIIRRSILSIFLEML